MGLNGKVMKLLLETILMAPVPSLVLRDEDYIKQNGGPGRDRTG